MRWSLCAREMCFANPLLSQFFLNGKVLPVDRGAGVDQPALRVAARQLARGDWVHLFPEGRIHFDGRLGPFRWGAGKLVCDARAANGGADPIVLPFYHSGMGDVVPMLTVLPRPGNAVHVTVGKPIDLSAATCRCNDPSHDQQAVWREITALMRAEVAALEARAPPNRDQLQGRPEPERIRQRRARRGEGSELGGGSGRPEGPA